MKIGILIDRFNVGGVEKIAIHEVRTLLELGHDARLLVLRRRGLVDTAYADLRHSIPIDYLDDRIPRILRLSFRIRPFYFFSLFHLTYPVFLPGTVKPREFDLIVAHNSYTALTAMLLNRVRGIPYLLYVWDPAASILERVYVGGFLRRIRMLTSKLARGLDRALMRNAAGVLVASKQHLGYLRHHGSRSPIRLLAPGFEPRVELPLRRGDFLLSVTAWKHGKRLEDLLDVMVLVGTGHLKVAGRWIHPGYRREIEGRILKLGLSQRVSILGEITEVQLNELYATARATVIVSEEQGFGLAAFEAAANGCACILPERCGAAGFLNNGVDALFFKVGDQSGLYECTKRLLDNDRLAYQIGERAWELVTAKYTWRLHANALVEKTNEWPFSPE